MREHDAARGHAGVEVLEARQRSFVEVDVEVGEAEGVVLDRRAAFKRVGEQALVEADAGEVFQEILHRLERRGVLPFFVDLAIGFGLLGQALECVEQVEVLIAAGFAEDSSTAALEDPDLGHRAGQARASG